MDNLMRLQRTRKHIQTICDREKEIMSEVEDIKLTEVIIARNQIRMVIAKLESLIRNLDDAIAMESLKQAIAEKTYGGGGMKA